jgi:hypothetical protein
MVGKTRFPQAVHSRNKQCDKDNYTNVRKCETKLYGVVIPWNDYSKRRL